MFTEALTEAIVERNDDSDTNDPVVEDECVDMKLLPGNADVNILKVPNDWVTPEPNTVHGEPAFADVDNPGRWPQFCFRPEFTGRGNASKYAHHSMPTGIHPCPKNPDDGQRVSGEWRFNYDGWKDEQVEGVPYHSGATTDNLFPNCRKGCLDRRMLTKLGLMREHVVACDALFFPVA